MTKTTEIEYGAFVFNSNTDEYELLFVTQFSEQLARNRAIEKANERNKLGGNYDVCDSYVRARHVEVITGDWNDI